MEEIELSIFQHGENVVAQMQLLLARSRSGGASM
jgi:hypothetical protein